MSKFSITAYLGLKSDKFKKGLSNVQGTSKGVMGKIGGMFAKVGPMLGMAVVAGAAVAAAAVGKFAKDSLMAFASFEKGMNEVFTLLPGISKEAMGAMSDDVLKLSKEMGVLPEEVVPALYQALSAGVPKENVFEFLKTASKAAIGGVTSLEVAVDAATGIINAYGKESMSVERALDVMFKTVNLGKTTFEEMSRSLGEVTPVAAAFGITFEEVSGMLAVSTAITGNTAKSMTGLKNMMTELGKEGMIANKNFERISGKTFPAFIKAGGTMEKALKMMKAEAEKTGGTIADLFGGAEAGLEALRVAGKETVSQAIKANQEATGAHVEAYNTMNQGITRSFDKIKASMSAAMIQIGGAIAPMVEAITPAIQEIADAIGDLPWKEIGEEVAKMAEEFKPTFKEMVKAAKALFKACMPLIKIIIRLSGESHKASAGGFTVLMKILTQLLILIEPLLNIILELMGGVKGAGDAGDEASKGIGKMKPPLVGLMGPLSAVVKVSKGLSWVWKKLTGDGKKMAESTNESMSKAAGETEKAFEKMEKSTNDSMSKSATAAEKAYQKISEGAGRSAKTISEVYDQASRGIITSAEANEIAYELASQGITESSSEAAQATALAYMEASEGAAESAASALSRLKNFGSALLKSAKGLAEDQTKAMQATLIKMGANAGQVMKLNGQELQEIFEETGEKGKAVMAEYQEQNAKQINHMKKALEALGVKQSELVGKSNEEIRRLWIATGEKGQAAYNGVIAKERQLQAEQAAGAKSQVKNQLAAANANVAASTKMANSFKPVVNAAKLSTEAVKKIGPAIAAATPPTQAYAKAIVEAAHAEDKLVARLAVQIQQGFIRMKNAKMYNMITFGTMKVMGVHLAQLRYGILYVSRMAQFAEVYAEAMKSVGPELKDLSKLAKGLEKGKFSIELIAKGLKFTGLLVSMDTSLKSIDKSLKGKFVNQ